MQRAVQRGQHWILNIERPTAVFRISNCQKVWELTMLVMSSNHVLVEIWIRIFRFLNIPDILHMRRVCGVTPCFLCFRLKYKYFTGLSLSERSQPLQRHMDWSLSQCQLFSVTVLFPHRSTLLFIHTRCLLTWRGRRHYTNTSFLFIRTLSSFCFFDLSMDLANS